ncbi:MAG: DUF1573 domain-containing protein [Planctomycetota bacterium]|nr:DUF1573 domain-containing protein [Planctomycetota bacterium]
MQHRFLSKFALYGSLALSSAAVSFVALAMRSDIDGNPSNEDLNVANVDLGVLRPGEKRPFVVQLRNDGPRTIRLLSPRTSCGCISFSREPFSIGAGEKASLEFTLSAPTYPGSVEKEVILVSERDPGLSWAAAVRGRVETNVWAEPSTLEVVSRNGEAQGEVTVHWKEGVTIASLVAATERLNVRLSGERADPRSLSAQVRIRGGDSGTDELSALAEDGQIVLKIPVHWRKPSPCSCYPRAIYVRKGVDDGPHTQTIVAYKAQEYREVHLTAQPLVSWIRVVDLQDKDSAMILKVQIDASVAPDGFNGPGLRFVTDDDTELMSLAAIIEDPS